MVLEISTWLEVQWAVCWKQNRQRWMYQLVLNVIFFISVFSVHTRRTVSSISSHLYQHARSITPSISLALFNPCQCRGITETDPQECLRAPQGVWLLLKPAVAPRAKWPSPKTNRQSMAADAQYFSSCLSTIFTQSSPSITLSISPLCLLPTVSSSLWQPLTHISFLHKT